MEVIQARRKLGMNQAAAGRFDLLILIAIFSSILSEEIKLKKKSKIKN